MSAMTEIFAKVIYAGLIIGFTAIAAKIVWDRLHEKPTVVKKKEEEHADPPAL